MTTVKVEKNPTYFDDPATDTLASIVMELAAELWVLRDRQRIVERLLEQNGSLRREDIESYQPTPEESAALRAERDAYVRRLFHSLVPQN